jgi:hypothetical protein
MGAEFMCRGESWAGRGEGKLLIETDELIFRGAFRLVIPFRSISAIEGTDGRLRVTTAQGNAAFEVGPAAAKWAERIRSPKSRLEKMGLKGDQIISVIGVGDPAFFEELAAAKIAVSKGRIRSQSQVVILGAEDRDDLDRLQTIEKKSLAPGGAIWVIHPKGVKTFRDIEIFAEAKRVGLIPIKVVRFSETHTGEKLVRPKAR